MKPSNFFETLQLQAPFNENILLEFPSNILVSIKREDVLHPEISGNKFRKLKYNIEEAKQLGFTKLLTFGGAFSNHILAVAAAGKAFNMETIGVIRGEELALKYLENPTLKLAASHNMQFHFIDRVAYREKHSLEILEALEKQFGSCYILPEGGTNALAIQGCEEILTEEDKAYFSHICCAVGTGGTLAGISNSANKNQEVIGFSSLKSDHLSAELAGFCASKNWIINSDFHFGGYGKITSELVVFLNDFYQKTGIPLDPIYTGKMIFGIFQLIKQGYFPEHSKILAIHTGGLQGIAGMNAKLIQQNKTPICY